jgi:hypothetical protein
MIRRSFRCPYCLINWPPTQEYVNCPQCLEEARPTSQTPIGPEEAREFKNHCDFGWWLHTTDRE